MHVELVSRSHHVEQDELDASGTVDWRYEYDLLVLRAASGLEVTVRAYSDEPGKASLLRFSLDGQPLGQGDVKKSHMEAVAAFDSHLLGLGFESVAWAGGSGYVEVPR